MPKKKLLLHCCCAPCTSGVLEQLKCEPDLSITLYFSNSNIMPRTEYDKRKYALEKFLTDAHSDLELILDEYDNNAFCELVKDYTTEPEGGKRCDLCIAYRMRRTAEYASKHGYDLFTTTLSVSPHKNINLIDTLGMDLSKQYNVEYFRRDFKKNNGFLKSIEMSKRYNIYRQNYCGCAFSNYKDKSEGKNGKL